MDTSNYSDLGEEIISKLKDIIEKLNKMNLNKNEEEFAITHISRD